MPSLQPSPSERSKKGDCIAEFRGNFVVLCSRHFPIGDEIVICFPCSCMIRHAYGIIVQTVESPLALCHDRSVASMLFQRGVRRARKHLHPYVEI